MREGDVQVVVCLGGAGVDRWRPPAGRDGVEEFSWLPEESLEAMQAFLEELDELFANPSAAAAWLDKSLGVL